MSLTNRNLGAWKVGSVCLVFLALGGCERTYGTSDEEVSRHLSDLTQEALRLPCLPLKTRSMLAKDEFVAPSHPDIDKALVEMLQELIEQYKAAEKAGMSCDELRAMR